MNIRGNLFSCWLFMIALPGFFPGLFGTSYGQEIIDIDARRTSVRNLEEHIKQREDRLENLKGDIRELDKRVEGSIEKIVKMLSGIKDSQESKVRVARLKADVVGNLRRSIEDYDRYRRNIKEQLRKDNPEVARKDLESDLAIFDQHVEKRVTQIKTIAESFTEPRELEKYVVEGRSSYYWSDGWRSYQNEVISEAWKQDRRESRHTDSMRDQVLEGLRETIDYLERRNDYLKGKLKENRITQTERELYRSDVERNMAVINTRKEQIESFLASTPGNTQSLDRSKAHDTEHLVEDLSSDLGKDFFAIFSKYAELNRGRAELQKLSNNLEARKQWLREYDEKNP